MSDNELKPCPFCGLPAQVVDGTSHIKCSSTASRDVFSLEAWNTRPIEDELCARLETQTEWMRKHDEVIATLRARIAALEAAGDKLDEVRWSTDAPHVLAAHEAWRKLRNSQ